MTTKKKTNDEQVRELFKVVQAKKVEIEKLEKPCWETSCEFGFSINSGHDRIKLSTVTDTRKLVEIMAFLIDRKEKSEKAAEELGVKYDFTWLGFTVDEWKNDLKTRVNQISIQQKRKELSELESRLNAIISPELRAEMELEAIKEALGE